MQPACLDCATGCIHLLNSTQLLFLEMDSRHNLWIFIPQPHKDIKSLTDEDDFCICPIVNLKTVSVLMSAFQNFDFQMTK